MMKPAILLLSSSLATLRSGFCPLFNNRVAVYPERNEGAHSSTACPVLDTGSGNPIAIGSTEHASITLFVFISLLCKKLKEEV
jgi:hypothetical protein